MPVTKEEILEKHISGGEIFTTQFKPSILSAMDSWAALQTGERDERIKQLEVEVKRLSWMAAHYGPESYAKEKGYEYDDYAGERGGWIKRGIPFQNVLEWGDLRGMFIKDKNLII